MSVPVEIQTGKGKVVREVRTSSDPVTITVPVLAQMTLAPGVNGVKILRQGESKPERAYEDEVIRPGYPALRAEEVGLQRLDDLVALVQHRVKLQLGEVEPADRGA